MHNGLNKRETQFAPSVVHVTVTNLDKRHQEPLSSPLTNALPAHSSPWPAPHCLQLSLPRLASFLNLLCECQIKKICLLTRLFSCFYLQLWKPTRTPLSILPRRGWGCLSTPECALVVWGQVRWAVHSPGAEMTALWNEAQLSRTGVHRAQAVSG